MSCEKPVMTAVATTPVMNNRDSGSRNGTEHSPSRFTAVNGKESTVAGSGAEDSVPVHAPTNSEEHAGHSGEKETLEVSHQDQSQPDDQSQKSPPSTHPHKRKRSESAEQESRLSDGGGRGSTNESNDGPPALNGAGPGSSSDMESTPTASLGAAPPAHRVESNETPQPDSNGPSPAHESQLISQAQRAQQIDASDARLAIALQREGHVLESRAPSRPIQSAPSMPPVSTSTHASERPTTAVQVAPKRKRVFSNRTKTGCMTCRRRKKKCDEQHPVCNNCLRGGFQCEGYSPRATWQKPSSSKPPVPLQSKEGFSGIGSQYLPETAQHDRQSGLTEPLDSRKMKPIIVDDSERSSQQYTSSPTGTSSSHASWAKRPWPGASQPPYVSDHLAKHDYREIPPIQELSREGPPQPGYPVVPPIRDLSHGPPHKPTMPLFQSGVEHRSLPAASMDTNSPQVQARMALSIEHQLASRILIGDDTEKAKMIRGEPYRPFDVQLVEERDRCKGALWRFNNACSPVSGLNSKEQNRLLKEVLIPPSNSVGDSPSSHSGQRLVGSIGQGSIVEAPFSCHYGWHITVEADVMISQNCSFIDDCGIKIGANTWIGPNVTLLSAMANKSIQERRGPQSRYEGKTIIIEQDCYIGAGSTILPGIIVGRGAYVAPGDIVKHNIPQYGSSRSMPNYP